MLAGIGFGVGTIGTLIGAGGGFLMVPILLYLDANEPPEIITAISLSVVFFNSLSGSVAYAYRRRISYKSGTLFALASIPGVLLGVVAVQEVSREIFEPIFAGVLILGAIYLLLNSVGKNISQMPGHNFQLSTKSLWTGSVLSLFVGFVSSFLGIGGGVIHVPALTHLLGFPIHVATATSHFVLAITSLIGVIYHFVRGDLSSHFMRVVFLALGAVIGAQLGAKLSEMFEGKWIIRALSIALLAVGLRLIWVW